MNVMPIRIIILPLLLLIILGVALFLVKKMKFRMNRLMTWRNNARLAGLYVVLLIALLPIYYLLPSQGFMQAGEENNLAFSETQRDFTYGYNPFPPEGNPDQLPGVYKNDSHQFEIDTNKLMLEESPNTSYRILIARKDVDDGKIEVSSYITPHVAGGIDFTKSVLPPAIFWQQGTLLIQAPSQQQLEFRGLISDFTIKQFKQVNQGIRNMGSTSFGWKVIYLRVPKSMEIDSGTTNVQMVDK